MNLYFTKTFFKFFFGFLIIIGVAFGVLIGASLFVAQPAPAAVDNLASPQ